MDGQTMKQRDELPMWVVISAIVIMLMILQFVVKPWYMADCVAQGRTEAQCEFSWKWRR